MSIKNNIFSLYQQNTQTLTKGGKKAVVGEVRDWGQEKWVKHPDGWVKLNKYGIHHKISLKDDIYKVKSHSPATKNHVKYALDLIKEKEGKSHIFEELPKDSNYKEFSYENELLNKNQSEGEAVEFLFGQKNPYKSLGIKLNKG